MNANKQDAGGLPNEMGFEQWYVMNTFDYPSNPLGSRDCSIARKAWHAALEAVRNGEQRRDAGGLPLLQFAVFDEFGKGADDRVQDYGQRCFDAGRELCRAAPAGGDPERGKIDPSWSLFDRVDFALRDAGFDLDEAANIAALASGSAPAGSGEVHPIPQELFDRAHRLRELAAANRLNECLPTIETMCGKNAGDAIRDAAALLRKLQQGADYSFRVLEVGEVILEHDEYVNDYGQWAKVKPPFLGMAYMLNMRTVRRAASQGQEGGHARD